VDNRRVAVDHYENFPVASRLCPPDLRPAVAAIYRFARTADDLADEGDAPACERLRQLDAFEAALNDACAGRPVAAWSSVFGPLKTVMDRHALPIEPFVQLLSAFRQDVGNPRYVDRSQVLDYCHRSADPIGRLLLHLAGIHDLALQRQSDAICTALQLINFWQDLSVDLRRGRCYVPRSDASAHGVDLDALRGMSDTPATRALVADLVAWSRAMLLEGAPLVHRMPGRFGWELRVVVQAGLRVLDKIQAHDFNALSMRPTIGRADKPVIAWRALWMKPIPGLPLPASSGSPLR
jgi:squalene synthase HpnC